ncbi:hypothetical protein ACFY0R_09950 [Streptomyces sp. NPDC001633]|uniref:hypothetical protein n=1 Tax=Streptomyces sp. NPDC001633 TaxID=3364595 RepID=UPI0036A8CFC6
MDQDTTVAQLIERLSTCNPDAVVRLAIAPDFPFAHYLGRVVEGRDEDGAEAIFLAEGGQQYYLPFPVAAALSWVSDPTEPAPARRRARRSSPPR